MLGAIWPPTLSGFLYAIWPPTLSGFLCAIWPPTLSGFLYAIWSHRPPVTATNRLHYLPAEAAETFTSFLKLDLAFHTHLCFMHTFEFVRKALLLQEPLSRTRGTHALARIARKATRSEGRKVGTERSGKGEK